MVASVESSSVIIGTERFQQGLQKALGHDLPNHLVAIQGMLRLLELEQSANLSAEGQGYLKRLTAATARTQALIRTLHLFVGGGRTGESWEDVSLADTAHGAAAEVQGLFPDRDVEVQVAVRADRARVPGRSFRLVLVQLLAQAVQSLPQTTTRLQVGSAAAGDKVLIWVAEKEEPNGADVAARAVLLNDAESPKGDHLLSLILVREIVAAWPAQLRVDVGSGRPMLFALVLPGHRTG
jgi:light-regulated signal transduction histidine kinase (bacteriophytochrome)